MKNRTREKPRRRIKEKNGVCLKPITDILNKEFDNRTIISLHAENRSLK